MSDGGDPGLRPAGRRRLSAWLAAGLAGLACTACDALFADVSPPVVANAGPDQQVALGETLTLDGSRSQAPPLRLWLTDGEGNNRNKVVVYDSTRGITTVGPLRNMQNAVYGYPSDLVAVNHRVIGVDTYHRQLYELFPEGGRLQALGAPSRYKGLSALAYDAQESQLYALDAGTNSLLRVDLETGETHPTAIKLPGRRPMGLAFDPQKRLLVVSDEGLRFVYTVDPQTGRWGSIVKLEVDEGASYDELAMHEGRLYALYHYSENETGFTQMREVDLDSGEVHDVGPPLAQVSPRSLLILDVPPRSRWSVVEGPGEVVFEAPGSLVTNARFEREGRYELELRFETDPEPVSDTVVVQVTAPVPD